MTKSLIGFVLIFLSLIIAGCFLVYTEHYGWAWIPFLYAGYVKVG